jgi:hypothetical protein
MVSVPTNKHFFRPYTLFAAGTLFLPSRTWFFMPANNISFPVTHFSPRGTSARLPRTNFHSPTNTCASTHNTRAMTRNTPQPLTTSANDRRIARETSRKLRQSPPNPRSTPPSQFLPSPTPAPANCPPREFKDRCGDCRSRACENPAGRIQDGAQLSYKTFSDTCPSCPPRSSREPAG